MVSIKDKIKKFNDKIIDDLEQIRKVLPLSRGGKFPERKPSKGRNRGKLPTSPAPAGDEVRFRPTEPFRTEPRYEDYPQFNLPPLPTAKEVPQMDIIEEIVNNPAIQITSEMLPIINDPNMLMKNGQLFASLVGANLPVSGMKKRKRKVSEYQKLFGMILKELKKKHPRTRIQDLMKRAHRMTRKQLKK
jgi:hypothetical protein